MKLTSLKRNLISDESKIKYFKNAISYLEELQKFSLLQLLKNHKNALPLVTKISQILQTHFLNYKKKYLIFFFY
jgi:hypothetical protein